MKLSIPHEQMDGLMRALHAAAVPSVLCLLTGPGWIVELPDPAPRVDLSAYRVLPQGGPNR